jgi:hypothetical protein
MAEKESHEKDIQTIIEKISTFIKRRLTDEDDTILETILSEINHVSERISKKIDDEVLSLGITEEPIEAPKVEGKVNERLKNKIQPTNENFPGPGEIVDAKYLDYDMLDYFNRMNIKLSIDTNTKKGIYGSVGKMYGDFSFNGDTIDKKDIVQVKILESNVNERLKNKLRKKIKEIIRTKLINRH